MLTHIFSGHRFLLWCAYFGVSCIGVVGTVSLCPAVGQGAPSPQTYTVLMCNDGDTCRLKGSDGILLKVRLAGIDAPEFKKPDGSGTTQPLAEQGKTYLNTLIAGKKVHLNALGTDVYNRNLAEVFLGDLNVNVHLIEGGYVEVYRGRLPTGVSEQSYRDAQAKAKRDKKGIWAVEGYESPHAFRKRSKK